MTLKKNYNVLKQPETSYLMPRQVRSYVIVDPEIQTVNEASVRYNKEYEKTLYSQLQSPGGSRVVKGRQNDCADCSRICGPSHPTQQVEKYGLSRLTRSL